MKTRSDINDIAHRRARLADRAHEEERAARLKRIGALSHFNDQELELVLIYRQTRSEDRPTLLLIAGWHLQLRQKGT